MLNEGVSSALDSVEAKAAWYNSSNIVYSIIHNYIIV